jgi:hypothetical protein
MQAQENNLFVQALQHTLQGKGYPVQVKPVIANAE